MVDGREVDVAGLSMDGWFEAPGKIVPSRNRRTSSRTAYPTMASVLGGWQRRQPWPRSSSSHLVFARVPTCVRPALRV
jgi:hypothetical protein